MSEYSLDAGAFLGKGTYGCVFDPPLLCKNESMRRKGVGKIFVNKSNFLDEKKHLNTIATIDKDKKYTIQFHHICKVLDNDIKKKDEFQKCNKKSYKYYQIILNEKGENLNNELKTKDLSFKKILTGFINLSKGIVLFGHNNYCHRDIKSDNIIVTDKLQIFKFIDFGLSCDFKQVYDMTLSEYLLKYDYSFFPPEFKYYYYITKSISIKKSHIYSNYKDNEIYFDSINLNLSDNIDKYFNDIQESKDLYFKEIINNINKVDVFSLGMVLLKMYHLQHENIDIQFHKDIINIITNSIHFDYRKRYTSEQLLSELNKLNKKVDKQLPTEKQCSEHKILNPLTKRCVKRNGKIGKQLLGENNKKCVFDKDTKKCKQTLNYTVNDPKCKYNLLTKRCRIVK